MDLAGCHLIGYEPEEIPTVKNAVKRGLCPPDIDGLRILGEDLEQLVIRDFKKPESHFNLLKLLSLPPSLNDRLVNVLASKPMICEDRCVGCGECARCCPPKAMDMSGGKPRIDRKRCIRCFCCQELCPQKAVAIKRPFMNKFMIKFLK